MVVCGVVHVSVIVPVFPAGTYQHCRQITTYWRLLYPRVTRIQRNNSNQTAFTRRPVALGRVQVGTLLCCNTGICYSVDVAWASGRSYPRVAGSTPNGGAVDDDIVLSLLSVFCA